MIDVSQVIKDTEEYCRRMGEELNSKQIKSLAMVLVKEINKQLREIVDIILKTK